MKNSQCYTDCYIRVSQSFVKFPLPEKLSDLATPFVMALIILKKKFLKSNENYN